MWNLNQNKTGKDSDTENKLVAAGGMGKKVQGIRRYKL